MFNRRIITVLLLGFSSGLPLALTGSTLQAWYTKSGVNLLTIGALSLAGIPYVWKFLWAPIMDKLVPPWWGRRRGWISLTQLGLCIALFGLSNMNPGETPGLVGIMALCIAFLGASQDIAIDAYRADILRPEERGLGAAATTFGFRIAMLTSGALALILADHVGWRLAYEIMAVLMGISILATYWGPDLPHSNDAPSSFKEAIINPFREFKMREGIGVILLFVVLYKFGDALALSLITNFLLNGMGFTLTEIGIANKAVAISAAIAGAFVGGLCLVRMNLFSALFWFGLAQAFSNLMFMLLAYVGKNYGLMVASVFIENFCSGLSTAAFLAFLMSLCNKRYSATQFASLSALSTIGRVFLGPLAALMVTHLGWINFFFSSFLACFPGIILLSILRRKVSINEEVVEY